MGIHPLAGTPAPVSVLVNVSKLLAAYSSEQPDVTVREQRVAFGTSGHRGSSFKRSFNEWHILAVTQAICEYRAGQGTVGPLYLSRDTHALSEPACVSAIEVLAANGAEVMIDQNDGYTPTPVISHATLTYTIIEGEPPDLPTVLSLPPPTIRRRTAASSTTHHMVDRPTDTQVTKWIEDRANALQLRLHTLPREAP